jgi:nucleoside-triphosphatase THEP1
MKTTRYGADVGGFGKIIRIELGKPPGEVEMFVVDEIGKMECMSPVFVAATIRILDGPVPFCRLLTYPWTR